MISGNKDLAAHENGFDELFFKMKKNLLTDLIKMCFVINFHLCPASKEVCIYTALCIFQEKKTALVSHLQTDYLLLLI